MHPFDFLPNTPIITGDDTSYYDGVDQHYLDICRKKTILEIATSSGIMASRILLHNPQSLTMVEPFCIPTEVTLNDNVKHISDDIHHWLDQPRPAQVVIAFGLLYHLHSPLHLIELIVNFCDPETIILDNVTVPHPLAFNTETNNVAGQRQTLPGWKHAPFNMPTPFFIINQSLNFMGYNLVKSHYLKTNWFPKSNGWIAEWTKNLN
tara:strand:- start:3238 stop:3858 length:621 start_codon:yes stop_codon:yes gene_type:complete